MSAIFKREFKSYFLNPIGYIALTAAVFFSGLFFASMLGYGYSEIGYVFQNMFTIVLILTPILTMRLFSEDRRQKVDRAIFTAPIGTAAVVLGKFFATLCFFMLMFAPTVIYELVLSGFTKVDLLGYLSDIIGALLLGASLVSIGIFVSSLTESQVVAAIGSFAVSFFLLMLDTLSDTFSAKFVSTAADAVSFSKRYLSFINGQLELSNIVFFLSFTALFIGLTVTALENRRRG